MTDQMTTGEPPQQAVTPAALHDWMASHALTVHGCAMALGVAPRTVQRWIDGSRPTPPELDMALRSFDARDEGPVTIQPAGEDPGHAIPADTTSESCRCCQRVTKLLDPTELCEACWRHALLPRHDDGTIDCPVCDSG